MIVTYKSPRYEPGVVAARYVAVNTLSLPPGDFKVFECLPLQNGSPKNTRHGAGPTIREYVCDADELPADIATAAEAKRNAPWPNAVEWPL